MCGIIGATKSSEKAIRDSLATFAYRGPDARQYFSDGTVQLGHARLSIIDLDSRAHQPFFDDKKEIGIVFNGEIYNYQELRKELEEAHAVHFRTTSDTEVLVEGYRAWGGEALLPRLRGMFAFAIYDLRTSKVFLARDHAGIKPLYYSTEHSTLFFASELKGIVSLMREAQYEVIANTDVLGLYQVLGYVPSPHTLVRGVLKLERGAWLEYDIAQCTATRGAWSPATIAIDSVAGMEDAIKRSVIEHCIADVPVGAFFSGGIDSSLIAAVLQEAGMDLATYSIQVEGRAADEPYFNAIVKELGVKAHIARFGLREFDESYQEILSRVDEPIADTSLFPTTFVSRLAAKEVKVVLSGEGGDELFLGYGRAIALAHMKQQNGAQPSHALDALFLSSPSFSGKNTLFIALAQKFGFSTAYYLLKTSPARDLSSSHAWKDAEALLTKGDQAFLDRDWYLENMMLRKTDMATSYASIEGRVPLLGAELWNNAPHFITENLQGGGKGILKDMLAKHIPRELIDRPKAGFGLDIENLFRNSQYLSEDLHKAILALRGMGVDVSVQHEEVIQKRYPVYGFGLVVLHNALRNLGLIY